MKKQWFVKIIFLLFLLGCSPNVESFKIQVKNPLNNNVLNNLVKIKLNKLKGINPQKLGVFFDGKELPSQLIDSDSDGKLDMLTFLVDLKAGEIKTIKIKEQKIKRHFVKRAYAEVSEKRGYKLIDGVYTGGYFKSVKTTTTPPGHIDHNYYYKCEGPCWESDRVGYRLYLDWRNSVDVFGKKVADSVLPNVGHTKDSKGHDSYHTMSDWGMDIYKVGNSLGIGTFGAWINGKVEKVSKTDSTICIITNDGPIVASINIKYFGWNFGKGKSDLNSNIQIIAGSRLTHYSFYIQTDYNQFCTGIANHPNTTFLLSNDKSDNHWNYIALWGKQSLAGANDELGTAIFYNNKQKIKLTEDELSKIIILKPVNGKIDYYFAACWQQEPNGIKNIKEYRIW